MWSVADIADALERGVVDRAAELDSEQAVYGIDAQAEIELHPLLAASLANAGYGVYREQQYPSDRERRRRSEGERCDLVLTFDGRPLRDPESRRTLFETPDTADVNEAYWLEVKVVAQYTVDGPNARYTSQMLSPVRRDVVKLAKDRFIYHAGVLLLLFIEDERVAAHDLEVWMDQCLRRSLPVGAPAVRGVPLANRLGNAHAAIAVVPVGRMLEVPR